MSSLPSILLFLALCWPFLAGGVIAAGGASDRRAEENDGASADLAIPLVVADMALVLVLLPVAFAVQGSGTWAGVPWLAESVPAVAACLVLHFLLLSQVLAGRSHVHPRPLERVLPFWTTGLSALALFLVDPVAQVAALLPGPALVVTLSAAGPGRAGTAWLFLRRTAAGALLALAGLLMPQPQASGVLTGLGVVTLAGLFPAGALFDTGNENEAARGVLRMPDRILDALRLAMASLLVVAERPDFLAPPPASAALHVVLVVAGLATVLLTCVRVRVRRPGRDEGMAGEMTGGLPLAVTHVALGLAAVAGWAGQPALACLALSGPGLALPWCLLADTRGKQALRACAPLVPGPFAALLLLPVLARGGSPWLALVLIFAIWPALCVWCRAIPLACADMWSSVMTLRKGVRG